MIDSAIKLIRQKQEQDENGVMQTVISTWEIPAQVTDSSRSEFFEGGRSGLNPEYTFTVFAGEYQGESLCSYNGQSYAIYRKYHVPGTDYLELYVQREGGTNGKGDIGYICG